MSSITSGGQKTGCENRNFALGLGPAWPAPGGAADVAERTEDTGPHGQNRRSPKLKPRYAILMLPQGWTPSAAAEVLERDPHTIGRWASAFTSWNIEC